MNAEFPAAIAPNHPALTGHFPGNPVVPGVLVLDEVLRALSRWRSQTRLVRIVSAKFLVPILPGAIFDIVFRAASPDRIQFDCKLGDTAAVTGVLAVTNENESDAVLG